MLNPSWILAQIVQWCLVHFPIMGINLHRFFLTDLCPYFDLTTTPTKYLRCSNCLLTDSFNLPIPCASLLVTTALSRCIVRMMWLMGLYLMHVEWSNWHWWSPYIFSQDLKKKLNRALGDNQSGKVSFSMCIFCVPPLQSQPGFYYI